MHDATVHLKDGRTYCGPIWTWRPKEGWFSLVDAVHDRVVVMLKDVDRAHQTERTTIRKIEKVDLLQKARDNGWDGT